eukprot:CAMPEP_0174267616 /NCGR_PEP_ID=MMETSP0439-20130205/34244_1 /TAXON_ID=0 /ORGANISM="Stereomyxa ramosa, Strain Chinc5" /LENGTH=138 /DNA_ID=CAMNT_0015355209 /DNA_START=307 /DNA_END=720 /DNA_ORIENTATION=-
MKMGVNEIEQWAFKNNLAHATEELWALRQASGVLTMGKDNLLQPEMREQICPDLSDEQLYLLLLNYGQDEFDDCAENSKVTKEFENKVQDIPLSELETCCLLDESMFYPLQIDFDFTEQEEMELENFYNSLIFPSTVE